MERTIDVIVGDERWTKALGDALALAATCAGAAAALEPRARGAAAFLFANDAALRDLNRRFRGLDRPTNVLSFPAGRDDGFLGDVAIAYETCAREAEDLRLAFRDHAAHLIVHGLLHLAGFDHQEETEAERMESLETRILATIGVADPYADPAAGPEKGR